MHTLLVRYEVVSRLKKRNDVHSQGVSRVELTYPAFSSTFNFIQFY